MTIAAIDQLARILTERYDDFNGSHADAAVTLARFIVAAMPVVRAAEQPDVRRALLNMLERRNGDWACAECRPKSDVLTPGFRCGLHSLIAAIDAMWVALEAM